MSVPYTFTFTDDANTALTSYRAGTPFSGDADNKPMLWQMMRQQIANPIASFPFSSLASDQAAAQSAAAAVETALDGTFTVT